MFKPQWIIFHNQFPEMLNQFKETFMVHIEMHMFKHKPFLFVGGGGGKDYYGKKYGKNSP